MRGGILHAAIATIPPDISQIDYLANIPATNRVTFNTTLAKNVPSVEYNASSGTVVGSVVYVKASTIGIKYTVRNRSGNLLHVTFRFEEPQYVRENYPNQPISLGGASTQTFELGAGATHDVTVTVTGMPAFVTFGELKAKINLESENGGIHWDAPSDLEQVFLTDAQPLAPIAVPWIEVLLDACNWADGQTGAADCSYYCTFGLYWSGIFVYNLGFDPEYFLESEFSLAIAYDLTSFFVNRSTPPNWTNGDCRDVSGYLNIATRALGVDTDIERDFPDPDIGIRTNPICPIGSDGSNTLFYYSTNWNFH